MASGGDKESSAKQPEKGTDTSSDRVDAATGRSDVKGSESPAGAAAEPHPAKAPNTPAPRRRATGKKAESAASDTEAAKTATPAGKGRAKPLPGEKAPVKGRATETTTRQAGSGTVEKSPAVKSTRESDSFVTAATKPRAAAARRRSAKRPENRSDRRTVTHKKPAASKPTGQPTGTDAAGAAADKERASKGQAPAHAGRAETAGTSARSEGFLPTLPSTVAGTTAAFMEAAFGADSHLPEKLTHNIERIETLTQRLLGALSQRGLANPAVEMPGPGFFLNTTAAWIRQLGEQPSRILGQQVSYWGETLRHFAEAQSALTQGKLTAPPDDGPRDQRFSNPLWENHPFFNFIKRQYQINAQALQQAADALEVEDQIDRRRIDWFTRQIIDMMAPTNFLATNPDALERALETEGESLVRGLENLVRDVEHHGGEMVVTLADRSAFRIGENLATTEGRVVARTPLYELIQYSPTTERVHELPVVIFPPWINKYYILDLRPENSLIRWIVDQGHSLFVVVWKNPDASMGDLGMDDYASAYLEVMDRVQDLADSERINAVGYCIAGTMLALVAALLKQRGDERLTSATFFTTLTDFSDQGEFTAYLQDDFVSGIEAEVRNNGMLSSALMQRTFSFLRANDLVWGPAIRSYMLGEAPPAFDLLFWNGDGTNLPGRMAIEYLRGLCQQNAFALEGFELLGQTVRLSEVTLPLCAIACEGDHIAPWKDSWNGIAQMGSQEREFILSESGHIAGIINPPDKRKYGHYTSAADFSGTHEEWRAGAEFHPGTWWGRWGEWLASRSERTVPARHPDAGFGPAPGQYVHESA